MLLVVVWYVVILLKYISSGRNHVYMCIDYQSKFKMIFVKDVNLIVKLGYSHECKAIEYGYMFHHISLYFFFIENYFDHVT